MKKKSVIAHYGSVTAIAKALDITTAAVAKWEDIIPKGRAYELEKLTKGKLKVDPSLYQKSQNAA